MIQKFTFFVEKLINAGLVEGQSSHEQFRLKSLNLFCLVCSLVPFVYIAMLWNTQFHNLNYIFLFFQVLFFLSVIYNFIHKYIISRLILVFTTSVSVVVVSYITGFDSGFHLYLYCAPFYVFLLFKLTELRFIFISLSTYIVGYVLIFVQKHYIPALYDFDKVFLHDILYPINLIMNFLLLLFLFYSYTNFYFIMEKYLLQKQQDLIVENTKRKESEEHIKKLFNDLTQSYQNLEQFSFVVSHNLRAPLSNILGLTKLLETENINQEAKLMHEGIATSANKIDAILFDLNYILQIKSQELGEKTNINLNKVIENAVSIIKKEFNLTFINIQNSISDEINLLSNDDYLCIIFYELFKNAIQFQHPDRELKIEISHQIIQNQHSITFADNGKGIDLELYKNRLFSMYGKFNKNNEGKGMGLYIVKLHLDKLNGNIEVESEVNKFTSFKITFD